MVNKSLKELLFKKSRDKISYSNTFVFRSRCKHCLSGPRGRAIRQYIFYAWTNSTEFKEAELNNISMLLRPKNTSIKNVEFSEPVRSMRASYFYGDPARYDREEFWERVIYCKCRKTFWIYKNKQDRHTDKSKVLNKR